MIKVRSIETAIHAEESKELSSGVNIVGLFDNLINPLFPIPIQNLAIIISLEGLDGNKLLEIRVNSPNDELIAKTNFSVIPDYFGFSRKVLNLSNFLVQDRGRYTVDLFEVSGDGHPSFISTETLFIAEFPPQRIFADGEIERILNTENLIKTIKTEYKPLELLNDEDVEPIKIQFSLDENQELDEGYIKLPEDCHVEIKGRTFDLTGLKRHMEWMFGRPTPTQTEEQNEEIQQVVEKDNTEEIIENKKETKKSTKKTTKKTTAKTADAKKTETKKKTTKKSKTESDHECCGHGDHDDENHVCSCGKK